MAVNLVFIPTKDYYALGRFAWTTDPKLENLVEQSTKASAEQLVLDGIVRTMVPDWQLLTIDRFEFQFIRVTFLGTVRCVVYDVKPLVPGDDGFRGRIYLEDKTWNIVCASPG